MHHTLRDAFNATHLYTDDILYAVVHLAHHDLPVLLSAITAQTKPFSALLLDKDEVTWVVCEEQVHDIPPSAEVSAGWRLITFDVVLEHDLVGFMAAVSTRLADVGVSIFALSAFERDHILVQQAQFGTAWSALSTLCAMG